MDVSDPLECARRIVAAHVPNAQGALLCGSVLTSRRSATSDLDIVVFVPEGDDAFRTTVHDLGWLAELFVQTPTSFTFFTDREIAARRSPLLAMCCEGVILVSHDGVTEQYQERARRLYDLGPPPLSVTERDLRRYLLTDLLDDFSSCSEPLELTYLAGELLTKASELALLSDARWLGTAKWLARRLHEWSPPLSLRLHEAVLGTLRTGDRADLRDAVYEVLALVGGPLAAGFRQDASECD